jgi:hypothetical protein
VSLIRNKEFFLQIFKFYIKSFYIVSLFGLLQFLLGLKGIDLLISQWWIVGILPRINGFSYEPSFFSTYLVIGWGICFYLYLTKNKHSLYKNLKIPRVLGIISLSIILSSSRIGIGVIGGCYIVSLLYEIFFKLAIRKTVCNILIICVAYFSFTSYSGLSVKDFVFLLNGIGVIEDLGNHSTEGRFDKAKATVKIFLDNPIYGVSLGGIPSALGKQDGIRIRNQEQIKASSYNGGEVGYSEGYEGQNIFAELLAASGLFGFPLIISYFFLLFYKPLRLSIKLKHFEDGHLLKSMLFAGFLVLFMLFFNQNILRTWLWIHIALINTCYFVYKKQHEALH